MPIALSVSSALNAAHVPDWHGVGRAWRCLSTQIRQVVTNHPKNRETMTKPIKIEQPIGQHS